MPTILTHPAVPLAIAVGLGSGIITPRLLLAGILASILHDLDVITLHFRLPYAHDTATVKLFGMGVTACFAAQCFAFLDVGLLQRDADPFGCMNDFVACDLQQAAVHRISDSFLLYGSVDYDVLTPAFNQLFIAE